MINTHGITKRHESKIFPATVISTILYPPMEKGKTKPIVKTSVALFDPFNF